MPYGAYRGPDKPNKGHEGGACNRTLCQDEPAIYHNHGTPGYWYCVSCAVDIGLDPVNMRHWISGWRSGNPHPHFETREEWDARLLAETEGRSIPADPYTSEILLDIFKIPHSEGFEHLISASFSALVRNGYIKPKHGRLVYVEPEEPSLYSPVVDLSNPEPGVVITSRSNSPSFTRPCRPLRGQVWPSR